ncbi:magnesium and cobalt transport protein CorA [Demequina aurantiaca]|uniref:magnesium and cobalt transport protein CorA n=1 Tax=Demequina aurantiaca TaxID=676200 RepID=UPI000A017122|nr:magnesium and cobalt transport protein CorA [Demequina aurantiaca]
MATRRKLYRPHIGLRRPSDHSAPSSPTPKDVLRLARYVEDGEVSRAPDHASVEDALNFANGSPNRMSMLLYAEPAQATIDELAATWGLHPLLVEDLIKGRQRPKIERYDDVVFLVARSAWYIDEDEIVEFAEFHVLLRENAVVVICQDGRWIGGTDITSLDIDAQLSPNVRAGNLLSDPSMLRLGPAAVAYRLLDSIVDGFVPVLEGLAVDKDQIERQVFSGDAAAAERIYRLSQEVIDLKQAISSLNGVVATLTGGYKKFHVTGDLQAYLGDLSDHLARVDTEVIELRESLTQILAVNATLVGQRQNEDMKKISGWAAILFAPTLIAAVYGMNFTHMPELNWLLGYPLALAMMLGFASVLYWVFKRRKWM